MVHGVSAPGLSARPYFHRMKAKAIETTPLIDGEKVDVRLTASIA